MTTFILGAGSNKDLNFPLGKEMYNQAIYDILEDRDSDLFAVLSDFSRRRLLGDSFIKFAEDLQVSSLNSIDEFVIKHKKYERIAKIVISLYIIQQENLEKHSDPNTKERHWYKYIWYNLYTRDLEVFPKSKMAFITFNYDRSLEYYLYTAIATTYKSDLDEFKDKISISELLSRIPIHHVYGKLNNIKLENETNYLDYGYQLPILPFQNNKQKFVEKLVPLINKSFNNIKLISTKRNNSQNKLGGIRNLLLKSGQVVFLGFAFNEDNMNILFPDNKEFNRMQCAKLGYLHNFKNDDIRESKRIEDLKNKYGIEFPKKVYNNILEYIKMEINF